MNSSPESIDRLEVRFEAFRSITQRLLAEVQQCIVGYEQLITDCLVAQFSQGHVLLEGVPGLGKTSLVKVLAQVLGLSFGRVQCTPDLMPADILGTHIVGDDGQGHRVFRFEKGPVFRHLLLVDEINRATPKTQSALLEVMQEHSVTAGSERYSLPEPFFVLATQNPLEMEGTYPLPEAQLDRFLFKLKVGFPSAGELVEISKRTTEFAQAKPGVVLSGPEMVEMQELLTLVPVAEPLMHYAAALVLASHPDHASAPSRVRRFVSYGASPRGMQAMIRAARAYCLLDGRTAVSVADLQQAALPALRHRMILNFEGQAEAISADDLVRDLLEAVTAPGRAAAGV